MPEPVSVVYVSDLTFDAFDPADLFDLAYLLRSERHFVEAICLTKGGEGGRVVEELTTRIGVVPSLYVGPACVQEALAAQTQPVNLIVTGGYAQVAQALEADRALFRERVARCFVVGGQANDYRQGRSGERLPLDPRLKQRHPDRFDTTGDRRVDNTIAWGTLLTSGEGIIWLPRDISLWRYAAAGMLTDGGPTCEWLLRETFYRHLADHEGSDRYEAWEATVLLSALPALLLAVQPDPFAWMRLFRAAPAYVAVDATGSITEVEMPTERPNLYVVVAIDGAALSKLLTAALRDRPLAV